MRKLEKFGLIYTISTLLFYLLLFTHNFTIFITFSPPYYGFMVLIEDISIIPSIISIIMIFRSKIKMTRIFGGITAVLLIIIVILTLITDIFYSSNFSAINIILLVISLLLTACISIMIIIRIFLLKSEEADLISIRKMILDLSTKFTRLRVKEIAEKCKVDDLSIINVIKKMIKNNEIYADYFKSSQTVAFDQQRNIKEIDQLMQTYLDWEREKVGKEI